MSMGVGTAIYGMGAALIVGLLVGLERERAKSDGPEREPAGIRTFALLGLCGAIAALLGAAITAVAGLAVGAMMLASYRRTRDGDPGLTTEVAMLATFLLGVLAVSSPPLACGVGATVAIVLASKRRLHYISRNLVSTQDLHDLLLLAGATFIVLPLLPDRTLDPWHALNPYRLWLLVIAVMAVSAVGYVMLRALGSRYGVALAGLAGGFVSSTATIVAMGDRARATPATVAAASSGGVASNVATFAQLAVVVGMLSPPLLAHLAVPLVAAGGVAIGTAILLGIRSSTSPSDAGVFAGKRPFEPLSAIRFMLMFAGIILLAAMVRDYLGSTSTLWVLAMSGIADVHAAAASAAQMVSSGEASIEIGEQGVLAALVANTLLKCVLAMLRGGREYALRLVPCVLAATAAFAIVLAID
ncbi:MgtC/SapB family protein [Luteibacter yeojuensis]